MFQNAKHETQCVYKNKLRDCSNTPTAPKPRALVAKRLREPPAALVTGETRETPAGDLGTMVKDDSGPAVSTRKRKAEEEHVQPLGASRSVP